MDYENKKIPTSDLSFPLADISLAVSLTFFTPSSRLFASFDQIIGCLLSQGRYMTAKGVWGSPQINKYERLANSIVFINFLQIS